MDIQTNNCVGHSVHNHHPHHPRQNRLLASLPREVYLQAMSRAKRVTLSNGEVIAEPGQRTECVYFPTTGVISAVVSLKNGALTEAAMIGNEGVASLSAVVDQEGSPYRLVQRVDGELLRFTAFEFRALLETSPCLRDLMARYLLTLLQQHAQNAACNLHHKIDERLCRWLLTTSDRVGRDNFQVTQEFLSEMLGVSRQSVNVTAGQLQQQGLIAYRRGNLRINDRAQLEAAACECYLATREMYERLMSYQAA